MLENNKGKNIGKEKKKITLCVTLYYKELKAQQPNKLKKKTLKQKVRKQRQNKRKRTEEEEM